MCSFLELEETDFDRVLRVNLKGLFLTGQAAARQMVKQGEGGTIINMSSVNAVLAIPGIAPYVASKGGVTQLTKVMSLELVDQHIRVNAIGPGSIATQMVKSVLTDEAARATNHVAHTHGKTWSGRRGRVAGVVLGER